MGSTSWVSLPVLAAFALFNLPARALPGVSMQVFRVDGRGVQAVPALGAILASGSRTSGPATPWPTQPVASSTAATAEPGAAAVVATPASNPSVIAIAASTGASGRASSAANLRSVDDGGLLAQSSFNTPQVLEVNPDGTVRTNPSGETVSSDFGSNQLTINLQQPLPSDMQGPIRVRVVNADGTLGGVQQEISNYSVQLNGNQITLRPSSGIPAGQNVVLEFPTNCGGGTCVYPGQPVGEPLYIGFNSPESIAPFSATATGAAATGAAVAGSSFPVWAIVLGVVVVGVGVAAASGAFSNGDGGGGTNPSSQ